MALRDQLQESKVWPQLAKLELNERDRRDIADVATGVHSLEAAAFLLKEIEQLAFPHETLTRFIHHVARYGARGNRQAGCVRKSAESHPGAAARGAQGDSARIPGTRSSSREGAAPRGGPARRRIAGFKVGWGHHSGNRRRARFRVSRHAGRSQEGDRTDRSGRSAADARDGALSVIDPKANLPTLERVLGDAGKPMALREWAANLLGGNENAGASGSLEHHAGRSGAAARGGRLGARARKKGAMRS